MKVIFLGVGEVFDENYPNNSSLVISNDTAIMLDCGDASVVQLWRYQKANGLDFNFLDAVYVTHRHSDHIFGLAALASRMFEEGRTKPFTIFCANALKKDIETVMGYAYQGLATNFGFPVNLFGIEPGETIDFERLKLSFVETKHSKRNIAIKVSDGTQSICYSGDGTPLDKTLEMYRDSDLVIHEAYLYDTQVIGHGCITDLIKMARDYGIKRLAFTHLKRPYRRDEEQMRQLEELISSENKKGPVTFLLPKSFDELTI